MSLLPRNDQQPGLLIRGIRTTRFHIEEFLLALAMILDIIVYYGERFPFRLLFLTGSIITATVLLTGGF